MDIRILLDTPKPEALEYLFEEMVDDQYVGRLSNQTREQWLKHHRDLMEQRFILDIQATVAYQGSGIVGIALSKPIGNQSKCANLVQDTDYWKMGNFYILKPYRGLGIGKLALKTFMKAKDNKVCYFADAGNVASIATAKSCGLLHTHDFLELHLNGNREVVAKGVSYRTPHTRFHVYFGKLPTENQILLPDVMDESRETN